MMQPPQFWEIQSHPLSTLLQPAAYFWEQAGKFRRHFTKSVTTPIPSLCIGNATIGGAGKTPTTIALAAMLKARGLAPAIGLRGYGSNTPIGVTRVEPSSHEVGTIGDEALLLARTAPCYVGSDRFAISLAAQKDGATHILFDDGLQNPKIRYDLSLLVIDGSYGFGNGKIIPSGPLRENWIAAVERSNAYLIAGEDTKKIVETISRLYPGKLRLTASLIPEIPQELRQFPSFYAFAGIGRPEKFFQTCENSGLLLAGHKKFPDHHVYAQHELEALQAEAHRCNARLLTTEKDFVRLPTNWQKQISSLPVKLQFNELDAVTMFLEKI